MTDVCGVIYPNVELRKRGLLTVAKEPDGTLIDFGSSRAFAMVDHQFAHVFVDKGDVGAVADVFEKIDGIDGVYWGDRRRALGMDNSRAGEIVLIARDDHWFQYYWWLEESEAPAFARTVDIHRKSGYDPVELFFDPETRSIPLDASLVKGSHGVPAIESKHRGAIICSEPTNLVQTSGVYHDTDVKSIVLGMLGLEASCR